MESSNRKAFVVGVGMTKFEKPGSREDFDYPQMAEEAVTKALKDANLSYNHIQQACVGYVYGDSTCGQRALYQMGMTGLPIINVNNNCATGSSALYIAHEFIKGGISDCVLALGFEKMQRGPLTLQNEDRTMPMDKHVELMAELEGIQSGPITAQMFGNAGIEHMRKYGTAPDHFAKIAHKNHKHSTNNPYSQFRDEYSLDQIKQSHCIHSPLTKLQCCPTSDGGAAAILASEGFVRRHALENKAVEIVAMSMTTDLKTTFKEKSSIKLVGYDMTRLAAEEVFKKAGLKPSDVDVVELHDCFSANELITYEALGLCEPGKAGWLIDSGNNTYGGKYVVNPSGGLISKGHPLGATGIAQCSELCWQLRGEADKRQVKEAKLALQHNIGLGGACVVALYRKGFPQHKKQAMVVANPTSSTDDSQGFKVSPVFEAISAALEKDGDSLVKQVKGVFGFQVKDGPGGKSGYWVVDAKNGSGHVEFNGKTKPDVTLTLSDADLWDLMTGTLNPQRAFFQGKLKVKGNMGLALKLKALQEKLGSLKSKL